MVSASGVLDCGTNHFFKALLAGSDLPSLLEGLSERRQLVANLGLAGYKTRVVQ